LRVDKQSVRRLAGYNPARQFLANVQQVITVNWLFICHPGQEGWDRVGSDLANRDGRILLVTSGWAVALAIREPGVPLRTAAIHLDPLRKATAFVEGVRWLLGNYPNGAGECTGNDQQEHQLRRLGARFPSAKIHSNKITENGFRF